MSSSPIVVTSPEQACEVVRTAQRISISGGNTKPALRLQDQEASVIDMRGLSGMIEYEPSEFVFTAHAGTPLREIVAELDRAGQYLPFDPMFIDEGGTLGGCIASGISGPGRFRFGGVRDFVIGVRFVDGFARIIKGGGKVVKNAAGFDFPKLMVGSLGRHGLITEVSCKVFPKPAATLSARTNAPSFHEAVSRMIKLAAHPFDLDAIELLPAGEVCIRIAGHADALQPRLEAITKTTGLVFEVMDKLPPIIGNIRVPINASKVIALDQALAERGAARHYSVAGNVAWITWPHERVKLDQLLRGQGLSGIALQGHPCNVGKAITSSFEHIVQRALDPAGKFRKSAEAANREP